MDKVNPRKSFSCRSISPIINSDGKYSILCFNSILNSRMRDTLSLHHSVGIDNHVCFFFSTFQTHYIRSMMNASSFHVSRLINVLAPLLSPPRDVLSLYPSTKLQRQSRKACRLEMEEFYIQSKRQCDGMISFLYTGYT